MTELPDDHPVSRQLAAYNANELARFIACFAPSIRLTWADGSVRAEGHDQLRAAYEPVFAIEGRRAEIVNRIVVGDWIVDHERVHDPGREPFDAMVAYHLDAGEIVEMRLFG